MGVWWSYIRWFFCVPVFQSGLPIQDHAPPWYHRGPPWYQIQNSIFVTLRALKPYAFDVEPTKTTVKTVFDLKYVRWTENNVSSNLYHGGTTRGTWYRIGNPGCGGKVPGLWRKFNFQSSSIFRPIIFYEMVFFSTFYNSALFASIKFLTGQNCHDKSILSNLKMSWKTFAHTCRRSEYSLVSQKKVEQYIGWESE